MKLLRNLFVAGVFALLAVPAASPYLYAQSSLTFKRVVSNWPTVELYFKAECNGTQEHYLTSQNFLVSENGIAIPNFSVWSPDPGVRCASSVALVLDASGSMAGPGNAAAEAGANAFVDKMDGTVDEAAVMWYNHLVTIQQGMTTNKADLHSAIDALPAAGGTALWDGMYAGLQQIITNGNNTCRAVVLLTDGYDLSSSHLPSEIIALANRHRIHVFTIGLGSVSTSELETVALLTGGEFHSVATPSTLPDVFEEIADNIYASFYEARITYQAECADGGIRSVTLSYNGNCGGSDTRVKTYRAPKDTSEYSPVDITIGDGITRGGSEVTLPLELKSTTMGYFNKCTFDVKFSSANLQFKSFSTPTGSIFEGLPITVDPIFGGVSFTVDNKVLATGPGLLGLITFQTNDVPDTTLESVSLENWNFEAGCYKPVLHGGDVAIVPRAPTMTCAMQAPRTLTWVRNAKDYSPNPFEVTCIVANTGDMEAKNVVFELDYNPADFDLLSPISDVQPGNPVDVGPGQMSVGKWYLKARTRLTGDSVWVGFDATFDNHKTISCGMLIWVPATGPILNATIDPIVIIADQDMQRYNPMPFDLNVTVINKGGQKTDVVEATIVLPPGDLQLAAGATNTTKQVVPAKLLPNQSGTVTWQLAHPASLTVKEYVVGVWVKTTNAESVLAEVKITIPKLNAPVAQAQCSVPDYLTYDNTTDTFAPNPFNVTVSVANIGAMTADNVSAFLYLPEGVELDPPTQQLRYSFGTLEKWNVGDPIPSKTWTVRYTGRRNTPHDLEFKFATGGISSVGGIPLDTVFAVCTTHVEAIPPPFVCTFTAPDTLRLNQAGSSVVPNPFTMNYNVINTGSRAETLEEVTLYFANDAGSLVPGAGNEQQRTVNQLIQPGDTAFFEWEFSAKNAVTPSDIRFLVTGLYGGGNAFSCEKYVHREAIQVALTCNLTLDKTTIDYDSASQSYPDPTLTVTATIQNPSGWPQSDLLVELHVTDPGGFLEYDSAYPNDNPWTRAAIFGGQAVDAQWHLRLARDVDSIPAQFVEFSVSYGSKEVPTVHNACMTIVRINPVVHKKPGKPYTGDVPLPDSTNTAGGLGQPRSSLYPRQGRDAGATVYEFALPQNYPNPFSSYTDIAYSLAGETEVTISVHNILGREVAQLVSERKAAGRHSVRFNAQNLPGGVYIVRMHAGDVARSRVIMLQR